MTIIQALILGLVQGLTEFIPVSSSGHLVLLHDLLGVNEGGLVFDVALHFGTLLALICYFHKDILLLTQGLLGKNDYQRLAWWLAVATIPAVVGGILLESTAESAFRSVRLVAVNLIAVALLMLLAERIAKRYQKKTKLKQVAGKQAIAVGVAQAAALVPGVSRSGATITTGLFVGLDRVAATRFSFLLGIPIMIGALGKVLLDGDVMHRIGDEAGVFSVGILAAFLSGLFAIRFLLRFLAHHTLAIFAYYRIGLGLIVLVLNV